MKSHEILNQFDKTIKSYIKMFEAAGLPAPSLLPHPGQAPVGRGGVISQVKVFLYVNRKEKKMLNRI